MEIEEKKASFEKPIHSKRAIKLNSCSFISHELYPIVSMAYNPENQILAIARETINIIEIYKYPSFALLFSYNLNGSDLITKLLFHNKTTILVICKNSMIYEFSLDSLVPLQAFSIPGGSLNDICFNAKSWEYLIACDDGSLKIYEFKEDTTKMNFSRVSRNFKSKSLACVWDDLDPSSFFASYENGMVRKFDKIMNVSFSINLLLHSKQKIFAWRILSLGKILVCGCSNGAILFFETQFGTFLKDIHFHESDILAMTVNSQKNTLFVSGSDSRVISIENIRENENDDNWVLTSQERGQSHDIYSLLMVNDNLLISGGLTTDLCLYKLLNNRFMERMKHVQEKKSEQQSIEEKKNVHKFRHITGLQTKNLIQITESSKNLLLYQKIFSLEVWEILSESNNFRFLMEIKNKEKAIVSSCISLCGTFLAYATHYSILIYHIMNLKVEKLLELPNFSASVLKFNNDSNILYFVNAKGEFYEQNIQKKEPKFISSLAPFESAIFDQMEISNLKDDFLAIGSKIKNTILIFKEKELYFEIPKINSHTFTNFKFSIHNDKFFVIYENNKFSIFDLRQKALDKWSVNNMSRFPMNYLKKLNLIIGIVFHPEDKNKIMLYSNFYYILIDMSQKIPKISRKISPEETEKLKNPHNFDIISRKFPILFISNYNTDEYLLCHNSWNQLLKNMPGAINTKKFGN